MEKVRHPNLNNNLRFCVHHHHYHRYSKFVMCFSQPDEKESGKPKKLKKSLCRTEASIIKNNEWSKYEDNIGFSSGI